METMTEEKTLTETSAPDLARLNEAIAGCETRIQCCESELADQEKADAENRADALLSGGKEPKRSTRADTIKAQIAELNSTLTALRGRKAVILREIQAQRLADATENLSRLEGDAEDCRKQATQLRQSLAEAERDLAAFPALVKRSEEAAKKQRVELDAWPVLTYIGTPEEILARAEDAESNVDRLAVEKIVTGWKAGIIVKRDSDGLIQHVFPRYCLIAYHGETGEVLAAHIGLTSHSPNGDGVSRTDTGRTWPLYGEKIEQLRRILKEQLAAKAA